MSYDDTKVATVDKDWIRFTLQDTGPTTFLLTDNEIDAYLTLETATGVAKKYYAAAELLGVLINRWSSAGEGIAEKQVKTLRIKFGLGDRGEAGQNLVLIQADLRRLGAELLSPAPYWITNL